MAASMFSRILLRFGRDSPRTEDAAGLLLPLSPVISAFLLAASFLAFSAAFISSGCFPLCYIFSSLSHLPYASVPLPFVISLLNFASLPLHFLY